MPPETRARRAGIGLLALALTTAVAACSADPSAPAPPATPGGSTSPSAAAPDPAATPSSQPRARSDARLWGVTLDDVSDLPGIVESLRALPGRPTARLVFDKGQQPADYSDAVAQLAPVADLLATPVDSSDTGKYSVGDYRKRFQDYLNAFGPQTAIWEVGNEVNGEWTGSTTDTAAKTAAAFDLVHAAGKRTALTLYYNPDCWTDADHAMIPWTERWIPDRVKRGVDYVFVSYYEKDCNDHRPDRAEWQHVFGQLHAMFPTAHLGFGESGAAKDASPDAKAAYLTRYYTMPAPVADYVGGYFWWYYAEDAVPYTRSPVWAALRAAMGPAPKG